MALRHAERRRLRSQFRRVGFLEPVHHRAQDILGLGPPREVIRVGKRYPSSVLASMPNDFTNAASAAKRATSVCFAILASSSSLPICRAVRPSGTVTLY